MTGGRILFIVGALVIGAVLGGLGGYTLGNTNGYRQAEADIKKAQEELAKQATAKAAEEAAKTANPFQTTNPLENIDANPFEKVKKVLNPFE